MENRVWHLFECTLTCQVFAWQVKAQADCLAQDSYTMLQCDACQYLVERKPAAKQHVDFYNTFLHSLYFRKIKQGRL